MSYHDRIEKHSKHLRQTNPHKIMKILRKQIRDRWKIALLFVFPFAVTGIYFLFYSRAATPLTVEQVVTQFPERRKHYEDAILAKSPTSDFDLGAAQGTILLQRRKRDGAAACDNACVNKANDLIYNSTELIDTAESSSTALHHAGAFSFLRAYLMFKDNPDLLLPATKAKLKSGLRKDGSTNANKSLLFWRNKLFNKYTTDNINFDIASYNPWNPKPNSGYNGTENHKLQVITTGMLLSEVYDGESYRGYQVKDTTAARDDYWHYFRDAFMRYSDSWGDGRTDHFRLDIAEFEKDSAGYAHVYIGDYWMIRDLFEDPVAQKHAEIMLDRLLADWAEDQVKSIYSGQNDRWYSFDSSVGSSYHLLPANYLLFDNLGYQLPSNFKYLFSWGRWAALSIATSDYNPTISTFPKVIIDVARNKADGYLVTDGSGPKANWVEKDFGLGFLLNGTTGDEHHSGGFFVHDKNSMPAGLNIMPYFAVDSTKSDPEGCAAPSPCNGPFRKRKPPHDARGVVTRRSAITLSKSGNLNPRLWIEDGFDNKDYSSPPWMFFKQASSEGREIYMAVRPSSGQFADDGSAQGGQIRVLKANEAILIWEVSSSNEHPSLAAFKADILDNAVSVTSSEVTYKSSKLGTSLSFNRANTTSHKINGVPQDLNNFKYGFKTPFMQNPHGSKTASITRNGYSATYNWDPNNDNNFDEMPSKTVDNTASGSDTTNPTVSITAPAANATVSGTLSISANAGDNVGISRLEFLLDNNLIGSDTNSPYSYSWDTTAVPNGAHTIKVTAYDTSGNQNSSSINVTVNNVATNKPPSVTLTAPANDSSYTAPANVSLSANAADSDGTISKVEFYQDVTKLGEDTTSPYQYSWNNVPAGKYSITAKAIDNAGKVATSTASNITVNSAPAPLPDLIVTAVSMNPAAPVSGQAVTFSATIKNQGAAATPANTILRVRFGVGTSTKYTWSDTHTASIPSGGSVTLTANNGTDNTATWTATAGNYTVTALVDDTSKITEANESNNSLKRSFTVTQSGKIGDLNGDGLVNIFDLSKLLSKYNEPGTPAEGDLNGDGIINITDLSILLSNWDG